jgi:hypothetical protein
LLNVLVEIAKKWITIKIISYYCPFLGNGTVNVSAAKNNDATKTISGSDCPYRPC